MKSKLHAFLWSGICMVLALALTFYLAYHEQIFFRDNQIISPDISLGPVLAYFFGVVIIMAVVLFVIPLNKLRWVFRFLFALMFGWGVFIAIMLTLSSVPAYVLAVIAGIAWLFWARIWLHDLLLLVALSAAGSVFGFLFSPSTFMIFMLIIAVYDVLAVRFGFMVWMADKMSDTDTLPAFVLPRRIKDWTSKLGKARVGDLKKEESDKREYSILGGGDIGFPLMLAVAVFFKSGLGSGLIIGVFALAGLMGAFLIQLIWFKNKPVPALPPIAFASLIGFIITEWIL